MTSTVATVVTEVQRRLRIVGSDALNPSSTELGDYVRLGFKHLIGILPPIQEANPTLSLSSTEQLTASLTANRVLYVASIEKMLVRGLEWQKVGSTLYLVRSVGNAGDSISAWHTAAFTITTGSTTTVDTTCIFGLDWLEEPATLYAEMTALSEMARNAGSASGTQHGAQYRAVEQTYNLSVQSRQAIYNAWVTDMEGALRTRLSLGDTPMVANRLASITNLSEIRSPWRP